MTAIAIPRSFRRAGVATARKPRRPVAGWALMGDVVSHRAGVSEHLIQWRRAMGEPDPEPMMSSKGWQGTGGRDSE